jgi:hypothetical protein
LERTLQQGKDELERVEIPVKDLALGMILDEDLSTRRDVLIAPRGCEVTPSFLEHIGHFIKDLARPTVAVTRRSGDALAGSGVMTA